MDQNRKPPPAARTYARNLAGGGMGAARQRTLGGLGAEAVWGAKAGERHRSGCVLSLLGGELDQHFADFPAPSVASLVDGDDLSGS